MEKDIVNIGKSVVIKGELNGSEDLTIEGHVEGTIQLRDHVLTIGPNGKIKAQVFAKAVIVLGEVTGNVTASEKVDIRDNGSVDGDIISPRVAIAEGAHFRGSVDMQRKADKTQPAAAAKPAAQAAGAAADPAAACAGPGRRPLTCGSAADGPAKLRRSAVLGFAAPRFPQLVESELGLLDRLAPRRPDAELGVPPSAVAASDPVFATKALRKFLTSLTSRESPVLLDLGPVVGSNVSFFGEQLGCKIFVEDIFADLDRHARDGKLEALPDVPQEALPAGRRARSTASCAGTSSTTSIAPSAHELASQLTRVLRPDGALLGFFAHRPGARHPLHEVHHRRRSEPETPVVPGGARPADAVCSTATSSGCSPTLAGVRLVPAAEQPARDPLPEARSIDAAAELQAAEGGHTVGLRTPRR